MTAQINVWFDKKLTSDPCPVSQKESGTKGNASSIGVGIALEMNSSMSLYR